MVISAQTRTASVSGNWNSTTTWGGQSVPVATDAVTINNGINVTVTANALAASITFDAGTTATTLTINSGVTLNVTGVVLIETLSSGNVSRTITGSGTLNCGSVNVGGTINLNPNATRTVTLTSTLSTFNVSGNVTLQGWRWNSATRVSVPTLNATSGTFTIGGQVTAVHEDPDNNADFILASSSPTLVFTNANPVVSPVTGTLTTTFTGTGATVNYGGTAQTIFTTIYNNLSTSGTGTKTLAASLTVNGALTVGGGTTLDLSTFNLNAPTSLVLSGGASTGSIVSGSGTLTLGGNVIVNNAATGISAATITCSVALGASRNFTVADDGTTALDLAISGIVSGSGFGISKLGPGTMELSAANSYTGATTVTEGVLRASTNNVIASTNGPFGNASSSLNLNGGTIQSNVTTFSRPLTVAATNSTIDAYGTARTISSAISVSGIETLDLRIGATTVTNAEGQDLTLSGVLSNVTGVLRLVKTGNSTATLSNTNTYSGSTTINGGIFNISADANLGSAPGLATANHLTISGAAILATTGSFTLSANRGIALGTSGGIINVVSGTLTYGGIAAGSGNSLTKTGSGALTLSGTNTFTGGFTLNAGTINVNNSQALGTAASTFVINGGTIDNTTAGAIATVSYPISWNADFVFTGTQALNLGAGTITMNASRQVTVSASTLTLGGTINHTTFNLTKAGTGTLSFGSQSVTINDITISAGTLTSTSGNLTIAGNFSNSGTFAHNSGTVIYNKAAGGQTIAGVTYRNLTLSHTSGTSTAAAAIIVGLNFTMSNSGATLDMATFDLSISGGLAMSGTIKTQSTSATPLPSASWGGIIEYNNASGGQTIVTGTYTNLKSSSTSGTNTASGTITVNGPLTVAGGGTLNMVTFALAGSPFTTAGTGTIKTQYSLTDPLPVSVVWFPTVEYNRSGTQSIVAGTYSTLITSGSGTKTMTGNSTVTAALTLSAGTLAISTRILTIQTIAVTKTTGSLSASTGTLVFDFNNTLNLPNSIFSGGVNNITLTGGAIVNLPATPNIIAMTGTLTLTSGKLGLGTSATFAMGGTVSGMSATNCIVGNGTGSIEIGGSGAMGSLFFDQTTPGTTNTISNFVINRTNLSGTLTIGNTLRVKTVLTPTAGTVSTNNTLVIGSDINGTARIYPAINAANFAFSGAVKAERYAKSKNMRRFLFMSSPVDNISVRNAWQDDIFITGATGTGGTPCGAGTGNGGVTDRYNSDGFDATTANLVTIYSYDQNIAARWVAIPTTSFALQKGRGYRVLYRGERGIADANCASYLQSNSPPAPSAATMNVSGTLIAGDFNVAVDGPTTGTFGYTLLGNPYTCELDFDQFASQNSSMIAPTYWTFDPNGTTSNTSYLSYSTTLGGEVAGVYHSDPGGDPNNYPNPHLIGSAQAFFVQADADVQVTFSESQKGNQNQTGLFKTQSLNSKIRVHFRQTDNTPIDNIVVRFSDEPGVTLAENKNYDAITFNSVNFLASIKGTRSFAIQTRPLNFFNDTVQLRVVSATQGNFKLNFTDYINFTEAAQIILIDQFTGTQTDVKLNPEYPFTITSSSASQAGRFKLVFRSNSSLLPLSYISIGATRKAQGIEVSWKVAFEQGVSGYEIQRSGNGNDFTTIGSVESKGNSNVPVEYVYLDTKPLNGTAYYRVKSLEAGGGKYSPVVKVNTTKQDALLVIYPNPVKDILRISLQHTDGFEKATITIRNAQGISILQKANVSANGFLVDVSTLANGLYMLSLTNSKGDSVMEKFIKF